MMKATKMIAPYIFVTIAIYFMFVPLPLIAFQSELDRFIRDLKNKDSYERSTAAEGLGILKDPRAVGPLIATLKDKDEHVRARAAWALGNISDGRGVGPLIAALKDTPYVQGVAVESLGMLKDPRAVEPLVAFLKDKNVDLRYKAAEALGEIKDRRAVEPLIAALKDKTISLIPDNAAKALGKIGDSRAVEPLIDSLKNGNYSAAIALGKIKDPRAVEPLIAALLNKVVFRRYVAEALGEIKDPRAVEPLIAALMDNDSDVRWSAAEALAKNPRGLNFLMDALKAENLEIIAKTYPFFIKKGESRAENVLIKTLNAYGDNRMAEDFLNCGNNRLEEAARRWASSHGYNLMSIPGSRIGPGWGR